MKARLLVPDNLSGKFLKDGATVLAKPFSQICNLSIKCSLSHYSLFKKGSKTAPQDYRPISLFPLIFKIIEKVIHGPTQNFLDKIIFIIDINLGLENSFLLIHVYLT